MESISNIKSLVEQALEDCLDDGKIGSYSLDAYRDRDSGNYFVELKTDNGFAATTIGFGKGYESKLAAWRKMVLWILTRGIVVIGQE